MAYDTEVLSASDIIRLYGSPSVLFALLIYEPLWIEYQCYSSYKLLI